MTSYAWQPSVSLSGDIAEQIKKIKQQAGPDLHVYGSANLVQTLLKHDLVDALWLKIFPITLGRGKRLFADGTIPAAFKVTESTVTSKGVIIVNYERAGAVLTGFSLSHSPRFFRHPSQCPRKLSPKKAKTDFFTRSRREVFWRDADFLPDRTDLR